MAAKKQFFQVVGAGGLVLPSGKKLTKGAVGLAEHFEGDADEYVSQGIIAPYQIDEGVSVDMTGDLQVAKVQAQQAEAKVAKLESDLQGLCDVNDKLEAELKNAKAELEPLAKENGELQAKVAKLESDLEKATKKAGG